MGHLLAGYANDDRPTAWMARAACADADLSLFFPEQKRGYHAISVVQAALAVCAGCPVRPECLEYGLSERFGVWGGTTEGKRRHIRYQRRNGAA